MDLEDLIVRGTGRSMQESFDPDLLAALIGSGRRKKAVRRKSGSKTSKKRGGAIAGVRAGVRAGARAGVRAGVLVGGAPVKGQHYPKMKKAAKKSGWLQFVKAYRMKHPNLSYKEALQKASMQYKKGSKKAKPMKKASSKRARPFTRKELAALHKLVPDMSLASMVKEMDKLFPKKKRSMRK